MARLLRRITALSSLVLLVGCGGSRPPATSPANASQGAAKSAKSAALAAPDLSPVAAPGDLFLVGRFKDPGSAVDTLSNWAGLPMDWRKLLTHRDEPAFSRIVAVNAPVDIAASLDPMGAGEDPQPFAVVTVGLNSLDEAIAFARKHGEEVHEMSRGVYRVGDGGGMSCAVAAAVGQAPARLVCGDHVKDVDALLPYVTRGMPTVDFGPADLHIEFRAKPFRRRYARELGQMKTLAVPFVLKELSLDNPSFDRALADAVHGLSGEFLALVEDLDTIGIDATLDKNKQVIDVSDSIKFRGDSSWTVQSLLDAAKRAGPPPDMFWKLPEDATSAGYSVSSDPKHYTDIARTTEELLDGFLSHEQAPRRVRDKMVDVLEQVFKLHAARVYARGSVPVPNDKGHADSARDVAISTIGWNVLGLDMKPAQPKKLLSELARLYNNRKLKTLLDKQLHKNKQKDLPVLRVRPARARGIAPGSTAYEIKLPGSLFEGSHFTATMLSGAHPKKKQAKREAPKALTVTLVLMPEGNQTWIGLSADTAVLYRRLARIHQGKGTLASRAGLAQLKSVQAISGGFMTLASFNTALRKTLGPGGEKSIAKVFDALPNHGETPLPYTFMVARDGGVTLSWSMHVPKAVVADAGALIPAIAALRAAAAR